MASVCRLSNGKKRLLREFRAALTTCNGVPMSGHLNSGLGGLGEFHTTTTEFKYGRPRKRAMESNKTCSRSYVNINIVNCSRGLFPPRDSENSLPAPKRGKENQFT